jgi:hypothetical protein
LAVFVLVILGIMAQATHVCSNVADTQPSSQNLLNAAAYIAGRYDNRIGLVTESEDTGSNVPDGTPCNRTVWIYSDNLWASEALKPFSSYAQLAENISTSLRPYLGAYGNSDLFEVVLDTKIHTPIHAGQNLKVATHEFNGAEYTVWVDRHRPEDGGIFYDADQYADLAFYLSLNYFLDRNTLASERWFRIGEAMWKDYGFFDKAANATGFYQNYKLGLYLLAVNVTGFTSVIHDAVERTAWACQKENGGTAALSYLNGTIYGSANVETTSAILLAYNAELIKRFTGTIKVGAYYYIWWGLPPPYSDHWNQAKGTPLLGKYTSSDPVSANQHIILAKQHKIDFFAVSWLGTFDWYDHRAVDTNLGNGLLKAPQIDQFNFCLFYESEIVLKSVYDYCNKTGYNATSASEFFESVVINDTDYAANNYFSHPSYLRFDGQPVLFLYNLPYLYANLSSPAVNGLLDAIRQRLNNLGVNVYLIGDMGPGPSPNQALTLNWTYSLNATTNYLFSNPSNGWQAVLHDASEEFPKWKSNMSATGVKFIPSAYPGYNNTGNEGVSQNVELAPDEIMFSEFLNISKTYVDDDMKMMMITSWNEWMESTAIEPSMEFGELFLHKVHDVIPEFPTSTILSLFLLVAFLTITICRRKRIA